MKEYLFKFDEPYKEGDADVFVKGCLKKSDNYLPIFINFNHSKSIGKAQLDFDDIGVFCKNYPFNNKNMRIGFVADKVYLENGFRFIEKCRILELSVMQ